MFFSCRGGDLIYVYGLALEGTCSHTLMALIFIILSFFCHFFVICMFVWLLEVCHFFVIFLLFCICVCVAMLPGLSRYDKTNTAKWQENNKNSRVLMFCYIPPTKSTKNDTVFRKTTKKWQKNDKIMTKKWQKLESFNVLLHSSYKIIKKWYGFSKNDKKMTK